MKLCAPAREGSSYLSFSVYMSFVHCSCVYLACGGKGKESQAKPSHHPIASNTHHPINPPTRLRERAEERAHELLRVLLHEFAAGLLRELGEVLPEEHEELHGRHRLGGAVYLVWFLRVWVWVSVGLNRAPADHHFPFPSNQKHHTSLIP